MDLTLYKVTGSGRVVLGDLAAGVEYYTVNELVADDGSKNGALMLTPVKIVGGATKRADGEDPQE